MDPQHERSSDRRMGSARNETHAHRPRRRLPWLCVVALLAACETTSSDDGEEIEEMDGGHESPEVDPSRLFDSSLFSPGAHDAGADAAPRDRRADGGEPDPRTTPDGSTPPDPQPDGGVTPPQAGSTAPSPRPANPADPGETGPWPVGVQTLTVTLGTGQAPVEVWYPAKIGSGEGKSREIYDFIKWLPPEAQDEVPANEKPVPVACNCYRDLPIDSEHGPYPVVIFTHNVGAFRVSSVGIMAHWASRGFIVLALDHPRLHLQDVLAYASYGVCTGSGLTDDADRTRDIGAVLDAIRNPTGSYAFLSGLVDATNVAVAGHSDGAPYAAAASGQAGVRLIMIWNNSAAVPQRGDLEAVAYFAASQDTYSTPSRVEAAYRAAAYPALYVNTRSAGQLSMTELCNSKNSMGRDGMTIARRYSLCDLDFTLLSWAGWDCSSSYLNQADANEIFGFSTSAALEAYLQGEDESGSWEKFRRQWGDASQHE
jgi:Platelet-activating factor acetylhydrolase, isoform II